MQKNTETWKLKYLVSTVKTRTKNIIPTYRYNGNDITLLSNGETIHRTPLLTDNKMQTILQSEEYIVERSRSGDVVRNRYLYTELECSMAAKKESDYSGQDFAMLEKNRKTIEFYKKHIEVYVPDGGGKNTNTNNIGQRNYELINLDQVETDKVELSELENRLMCELHDIYHNDEEFSSVAYMMGVNPTGLNKNMVFNTLSGIIKKDKASLDDFDKKLNKDDDRWVKTVINKALREVDKNTGSSYIETDLNKMYNMNGSHIASNYNALVAYMKDNGKLFKGLESSLSMVATGRFYITTEEESEMSKRTIETKPNGTAKVSSAVIGMKIGQILKKIEKGKGNSVISELVIKDIEEAKIKYGESADYFVEQLNIKAKESGITIPVAEVV